MTPRVRGGGSGCVGVGVRERGGRRKQSRGCRRGTEGPPPAVSLPALTAQTSSLLHQLLGLQEGLQAEDLVGRGEHQNQQLEQPKAPDAMVGAVRGLSEPRLPGLDVLLVILDVVHHGEQAADLLLNLLNVSPRCGWRGGFLRIIIDLNLEVHLELLQGVPVRGVGHHTDGVLTRDRRDKAAGPGNPALQLMRARQGNVPRGAVDLELQPDKGTEKHALRVNGGGVTVLLQLRHARLEVQIGALVVHGDQGGPEDLLCEADRLVLGEEEVWQGVGARRGQVDLGRRRHGVVVAGWPMAADGLLQLRCYGAPRKGSQSSRDKPQQGNQQSGAAPRGHL
eukprot:RCo027708